MLLRTENAEQLILVAWMRTLMSHSYKEHPHLHKKSYSFNNSLIRRPAVRKYIHLNWFILMLLLPLILCGPKSDWKMMDDE